MGAIFCTRETPAPWRGKGLALFQCRPFGGGGPGFLVFHQEAPLLLPNEERLEVNVAFGFLPGRIDGCVEENAGFMSRCFISHPLAESKLHGGFHRPRLGGLEAGLPARQRGLKGIARFSNAVDQDAFRMSGGGVAREISGLDRLSDGGPELIELGDSGVGVGQRGE